jgi:hypothetical protein
VTGVLAFVSKPGGVGIEAVLPLSCGDENCVTGDAVPEDPTRASREMLFQLAMLLLRLGRVCAVTVSGPVPGRLASSLVRSTDDTLADPVGNCVWMAERVLRTN